MPVESADIPQCKAEEWELAVTGRTLTSVDGGHRAQPPMGANILSAWKVWLALPGDRAHGRPVRRLAVSKVDALVCVPKVR